MINSTSLRDKLNGKMLEIQAFVVVLSFLTPRGSGNESTKKVFETLRDTFSKTTWYENIAIVWTFYTETVENQIGVTKEQRRREFVDEFILPHFPEIGREAANRIPQYFVDSIEARTPNSTSNSELMNLLKWAQTLQSPIKSLHILKSVTTEEETVNEGNAQVTYEVKKMEYTDGKTNVERKVLRKYEHQVTYVDDGGGGCPIL